MKKILLISGIASSALYIGMNIFVPLLYPGYSSSAQTVSELSAIDAPTRPVWVILGVIYSVLIMVFSYGVYNAGENNRHLRIVGDLLFMSACIGILWPPMHQRSVLAEGGGSLTDTLHIAFTAVTVILMILIIIYGAAALGRSFKIYSIVTLTVLVVFGILTGLDSPKLEANLPTPMIGFWERINIGAYIIWIIVLAFVLLRRQVAKQHNVIFFKN